MMCFIIKNVLDAIKFHLKKCVIFSIWMKLGIHSPLLLFTHNRQMLSLGLWVHRDTKL